jgi:hypothetical protein
MFNLFTPIFAKLREDYVRGWEDCAAYAGSESNASHAYLKGFGDCADSYAKIGWFDEKVNPKGTKKTPNFIPGSLVRIGRPMRHPR